MLKIFIQDNSWAGMIVVIATDEKQAREKMKQYYNYCEKKSILSHDIIEDFSYSCYGDS